MVDSSSERERIDLESWGGHHPEVPRRELGTTRGYLFSAIDPDRGQERDVLVPHHLIHWTRRKGKGAIFELDRSVRYVLRKPAAVFRGIRRDEDDESGHSDGWCCYSARAERYDFRSGDRIQSDGRVLLVFVNKEWTIYVFRWEEEHPDKPGYPLDIEMRFEEQVI